MSAPRRTFNAVEQRAAAWLARADGDMDGRAKAEFDRWLAADPRHRAAVDEVRMVWAAFDRLATVDGATALRARLAAQDRRNRHRRLTAGVALAMAACLAVFFWLARPMESHLEVLPDGVTTARISAPVSQTLPDGSVVEFKPGARITVDFRPDERRVILDSGEAHFSVTKNPQRPFIVKAGTVDVRAVGTAFAVQLGSTEVEVLVTDGMVSVASLRSAAGGDSGGSPGDASPEAAREPPLPVEVGQQATVKLNAGGALPVVTTMPGDAFAERLSWRVPVLEFSETNLAEAVKLFNRYGKVRLRTADKEVSAMRVTGVFRSDSPEGFAFALEATLGLRIERQNGVILLRRR